MSRLDAILEGMVRKIGEVSTRISRIETIDIPRSYRGTTAQRDSTSLGYSNQATFWDTDEQALYVWDDNQWINVRGTLTDADIPSTIARDTEVTAAVSAHAGDVNSHHARDHVLATTSALGSTHTVSGLTARQVLIATGSSTALFRALQEADIPSTIATDAEVAALFSSHASSSDHDGRYYKQSDFVSHESDVNAHHARDHVLASTSGLGSTHTVSGLSARQVLIATGSSTAIFRALQEADIPSTIATDSEVTSAVSSHAGNVDAHHARDHTLASTSGLGSTHTVSGLTARQVLIATGSSTALFRALQEADIPSTIATDAEVAALFSSHASSSDHDSRYYQQSEFSSTPGAAAAPLKTSVAGLVQIRGLAAGATAVDGVVNASSDIRGARGLVAGSATVSAQTGTIVLITRASDASATAGALPVWFDGSNLKAREPGGTIRTITWT